ncbi:hypothetical protein HG530_015403 [Fusarium avenaceum]|nr:hypothetical protein HG530_015403 [Fusarium avenaceum]
MTSKSTGSNFLVKDLDTPDLIELEDAHGLKSKSLSTVRGIVVILLTIAIRTPGWEHWKIAIVMVVVHSGLFFAFATSFLPFIRNICRADDAIKSIILHGDPLQFQLGMMR